MTKKSNVRDRIAETLVRAGTTFRADQIEAYERALNSEGNAQSKWVIEQIIENAKAGESKGLPLCDDTGVPHVLLEIGDACALPAGFMREMEEGVAKGLRDMPGRPMAVKGSDFERIEQSAGLSADSGDLFAAPLQIVRGGEDIGSDEVRATVLLYGGGPEIRGKTLRVFHKHSIDVVAEEMIEWAKEAAGLLGCQPCVFSFGIGRSNYEASALSLQAMAKGDFGTQSGFEKRITEGVNRTGIGSLGLGGDFTAIASFIKVGEQRASGVRVVSMRAGCCFDPRRASVVFRFP